MRKLVLIFVAFTLLTSCVARKKYNALEKQSNEYKSRADNCETSLSKMTADLQTETEKSRKLQEELDYLKKTNTNLLDRMADLSIISKTEQENIRKSLEAINEQTRQINELSESIRVKDSLNLALVMNLKRSLADVNDEDVNIEVKKGVVYISLSDKMLFRSGSYRINAQAESVLGKIASVANDHKELDLLVEGHTDSVPIATDCMEDNWDLSVKRATAVVRMLQKKYNVAPERMTAGGRAYYISKASNETADGRSANRRTEIIILPKMDQFFKMMEPGQDK